ncbi:hypothetical protein V2H45_24910 [Tumidithrix elongata RA019]|uniref:Uncharacterized protein n=1 Tax=Tumidithrix elongata BACA0141 TaxID=2716417 RepID=A0AAW9PZR7_9CYAN|nr:hypothetical protein [Tumidithrix elongata RA019]
MTGIVCDYQRNDDRYHRTDGTTIAKSTPCQLPGFTGFGLRIPVLTEYAIVPMASTNIERIREVLSPQQFSVFLRLRKMRSWLRSLYLVAVLTEEESAYICGFETSPNRKKIMNNSPYAEA